MTTPRRPNTAQSEYLRIMTSKEHISMATTLTKRKRCVRPHGTIKKVRKISLLTADSTPTKCVGEERMKNGETNYVCNLSGRPIDHSTG